VSDLGAKIGLNSLVFLGFRHTIFDQMTEREAQSLSTPGFERRKIQKKKVEIEGWSLLTVREHLVSGDRLASF
jgi:hypothetical protein